MISRSRSTFSSPSEQSARFLPLNQRLRNFRPILWLAATIEAIVPVASAIALYFWQNLHLLVILLALNLIAVGLVAFYTGFFLTRRTEDGDLGRRTARRANLGYLIGLIIVCVLSFFAGLCEIANTYDGFDSLFGLTITLVFLCAFLIGVMFGSFLMSLLGGWLGALLGKRWALRFPLADVKDESGVAQMHSGDIE